MKYAELIKKYINEADIEDMEMLTAKTDKFVEEVRERYPELAEKYLMGVDLLLNPHFSKETAMHAVSKLKNKDGTTGEHWSYDTTTKAMEAKGYNFKHCDWYFVLNMIYSKHYKAGRSDETYIELAYDCFEDKNVPEGVAKKYYKAMMY